MDAFLDSPWFAYGVLPLLIFVGRIADVSIGTMRIMYVARGHRVLSPLLGFFEVTIWLLAIGQIMTNLANPLCYIAYGAGFATGNYVGIRLEAKVATGMLAVRVITQSDASALIAALRDGGFGLTVIDGQGHRGPVKVLYVVVRRKRFDDVIALIRRHNPQAFCSVKEVRNVSGGVHPPTVAAGRAGPLPLGGFMRKGK
jgi:uncharacterized protein YebE (UPF0316 family)